MSHILNNPIWSALATRHAHFSSGGELARRYPIEVSPFVTGRDHAPETVAAMVALMGEGEDISVVGVDPPPAPAGVSELKPTTCASLTTKHARKSPLRIGCFGQSR